MDPQMTLSGDNRANLKWVSSHLYPQLNFHCSTSLKFKFSPIFKSDAITVRCNIYIKCNPPIIIPEIFRKSTTAAINSTPSRRPADPAFNHLLQDV